MRLTVGPLPPAVYWRRRAVVLGAVLLFLVVLVYSCSQPGSPAGKPESSSTTTAAEPDTGGTETGSPAPTPRASSTGSGQDASDEDPATPDPAATGQANATAVAAPPDGGCTDEEISVVPVPTPRTAQQGTVVNLQIKIKNVSSRSCPRDVGADLQEIYIKSGARRVWSSDTCGTARGSDVEPFTPSFERAYQVDWNGREASRCADGQATGPFVDAGEYQVFGRLGSKLSEPVKLTITG
ncbi:hypothetical protein [Plantactinospora sp. KBS50]|uniref:hypothetical protein n=1 Tax=Plantactinospora sp. KBS50 TaxID=2024580 RepID=UPI000BAAACB2|nr:hypothetical protein [Plantactinospora sp. KBS50]ASW58045.1 hypothetical protein CIK06_26880 [Plantactinospora sp. KBS50]